MHWGIDEVKVSHMQANLYKVTTEIGGLLRQVVFHNREKNMILYRPCQESHEIYLFF